MSSTSSRERRTRSPSSTSSNRDPSPRGVTPYTHFEPSAGVQRSSSRPEKRQRVEGFLDGLTVFELEPAAARQGRYLDAELAARGERVGLVDLLVGCIALHHGQSVVTRDAGGFEAIPGLEVLES